MLVLNLPFKALMFLTLMRQSLVLFFFFSSRRRHTISLRDWSSDVCSSDLLQRLSLGVDGRGLGAVGVGVQRYEALRRAAPVGRSEERRVGKECRFRWSRDH